MAETISIETFINKVHRELLQIPLCTQSSTFLELVRQERDENAISNCLAGLLENRLIRQAFISSLVGPGNAASGNSYYDAIITREMLLDSHSRIDLLIEVDGIAVIAIENKVDSPEGLGQTERYYRLLKKLYKDRELYCYILSLDQNPVQSKYFATLTYRRLHTILAQSEFITRLDADTLLKLRDFLSHIERYLMQATTAPSLSNLSRLYIQNKDSLDRLLEAFKKDSSSYFDFFISSIRNYFPEKEWSYSISKGFFQFYKPTWTKRNIFVHFEIWTDSMKLLSNDCVEVMIDAELPGREKFYQYIEAKGKRLLSNQRKKGFLYRPPQRKLAIAFKIYKFPKSIDQMESTDWSRLIRRINSEISEYVDLIDGHFVKSNI